MGKIIVHHGGPGSGQHAKVVNQMLVAAGMVGIAEGLLYARRSGLDFDRVYETVTQGAAASWSLSTYAPRINRGDFAPGFRVEHFIKDIEVALQEARELDLALPGVALAHELYLALRAQGRGEDGTHSLIHCLARMSDVTWDE
jgi:3-hydroxyisobutyrate dehydrogenase